jgi:hypothetical protein
VIVSRRFVVLVVLGTALSMLPVPATASNSRPVAVAARSCSIGNYHSYGYSYLTSLSVRNTSCGTGRHVAHRHGHISGWRCAKKRLDTSPVQYDDRETCTRGRAKVVWTFTQNT